MIIKALEYKDIGLISRHVSQVDTRTSNKMSTETSLGTETVRIPIIGSPMPDVCNGSMAAALYHQGCWGIIHRFCSIREQLAQYEHAVQGLAGAGCAIGTGSKEIERFKTLWGSGCDVFCIDVANGANLSVEKFIHKIEEVVKHERKNIYLIAGNVATRETFSWLSQFVDAVRVGIAGGSVCTTKNATGMYYPMVSSLLECVRSRSNAKHDGLSRGNVDIIADGSIKQPSDMCKALALGADFVMMGSVLAATSESPARIMRIDDKLMKSYSGAASYSTQTMYKENPSHIEGMESLIPYTGTLQKTIEKFKWGLRSSMSYMNAWNLEEYRKNVEWVRL